MSRVPLSLMVVVGVVAVVAAQSGDPKVMEAQRLKRLNGLMNPESQRQIVAVGQRVPDFILRDQQGTPIALSSLSGKVIALTFGYIRCPNPQYCFRLASNLGQLQSRFKDRLKRDLVLLTIMLDPELDQGGALAEYAHVWTTDASGWHFLTGGVPDVRRVAGMFGVVFLKGEGSVMHSLNTVVIDRHGTLAANLEGNDFTPAQLVDVVRGVLTTP